MRNLQFGVIDWDESVAKFQRRKNSLLSMSVYEGDTMFSTYSRIEICLEGGGGFRKSQATEFKRVMKIIPDQDEAGLFWKATGKGLYQFEFNPISNELPVKKLVNEGMWFDNVFYIKNHLFAIASGNQIFQINEESSQAHPVIQLNEVNILNIRIVDSACYFATNRGLAVLKLLQNGTFEYEDLDYKLGIKDNLINDVLLKSDTIWLATKIGLISVPFASTLDNVVKAGHIYIGGMKVNGETTLKGFSSEVYSTDNISFSSRISGFKQEHSTFEYRLLPLDSMWTSTSNRTISFFHLPPQDYRLELRLLNGVSTDYSFTVIQPFLSSNLFYLIVVLSIIALIFIPLFMQRKWQIDLLKLEQEKADLRLKWLASQLNPHFVFNALNSIQAYILKNDVEASSNYLTKFARYVRGSLDQSEHSFVRLTTAIESLQTYLELEKMRLVDRCDVNTESTFMYWFATLFAISDSRVANTNESYDSGLSNWLLNASKS